MNKIVSLRPNQCMPSMVGSFRDSIVEGFNRIVDLGVVDVNAANCMIGFFSAAAIACKCTGNLATAEIFEESAHQLNNDWTNFEIVCRATIAKIDEVNSK